MIDMKKCQLIITLAIVLSIIIGGILTSLINFNTIKLIDSKSYYSDFAVEGNTVKINCYLTIKSTYKTNKRIRISADFSGDMQSGLVKTNILQAKTDDGSIAEYVIPSKSTKSFYVTFYGEFGYSEKKYSRNLPKVYIQEVKW